MLFSSFCPPERGTAILMPGWEGDKCPFLRTIEKNPKF
jgi:hypothetical protein